MILIGEIHVVGHIEYYDEIDGQICVNILCAP